VKPTISFQSAIA